MISRRNMMLAGAATVAAGPAVLKSLAVPATLPAGAGPFPPGEPYKDYTPVTTPNGSTLPYTLIDGVKVFHLTAEVLQHEFAPGLKSTCWGYNGSTPGPTIEAVEGDRVRIFVTNNLPESTTVHWHGVLLPSGMDGVAGLTQPAIPPGQTFKYEFTLRQHGTHMYHPHFDEMIQMAMGMMGMFIIHPRRPDPDTPRPDRDFAIMLSEWRIDPGASTPNPIEMTDFNLLTLNSKAFPATDPLVAKLGQRVRIRFGNLGAMDHHPMHLHGYAFDLTEFDGGIVPKIARSTANSLIVPVGSTRAIDFVADNPGDWALHCHMTHHVMNQMGHNYPNFLGVRPTDEEEDRLRKAFPGFMTMGSDGMGEMAEMHMPAPHNSIPMKGGKGPFGVIDMGGMFTVLKVRQDVAEPYADPGWYAHPAGTVASPATAEELRANRITVSSAEAPGRLGR